jgi:hypothetical protein
MILVFKIWQVTLQKWVADVYRPIIDNETNDFNYFRGNATPKDKIGEDGKIESLR